MSKLKAIAAILDISESMAQDFCGVVQRFMDQPPSYRVILTCLKQLPPARRTPTHVMKMIRSGAVKEEQPKKKPRAPFHGFGFRSHRPPIFSRDPRDYQEGFEKCPHGVLKINRCCICDPEGFREETGIN